MKKMVKKTTALALTSAMIMGMNAMAFADDVSRDDTSMFTESGDEALTGITEFYIIKDYDAFDKTAEAPNSKSPEETFTYTIKPYAVWNAGNATTGNNESKITTSTMPMLTATSDTASGVTATTKDNARTLIIEQKVVAGKAQYEATDDKENTGDNKAKITLPTYNTVGDYWYVIEETIGKTTGVIYGTNSAEVTTDVTKANGSHTGVYYIHVQVTETSDTVGTSVLKSNVTMHTSCPNPDSDDYDTNIEYNNEVNKTTDNKYYVAGNKVNAIENRYYAGDLVINKEVIGNAGDKTQYFPVTVTFTKPSGTDINSDIVVKNATLYNESTKTYAVPVSDVILAGEYDDNTKWDDGSLTYVFYVKDDSEVTFSNIPYGVNYTILETLPSDDTYLNGIKYTSTIETNAKFNGKDITVDSDDDTKELTADAKTLSGSISDSNDTVLITNKKETKIDIGVILSSTPYLALLAATAGVGIVASKRRKDLFEE